MSGAVTHDIVEGEHIAEAHGREDGEGIGGGTALAIHLEQVASEGRVVLKAMAEEEVMGEHAMGEGLGVAM